MVFRERQVDMFARTRRPRELALQLSLMAMLLVPPMARGGRKELATKLRPSTAARVLTERDHGRKFWFHPRQLFWVELAEQPRREGSWELDPLTTNNVTLVRSERRYRENWKYGWSKTGHGGGRRWTFQADHPGIARLVFRKTPVNPRRAKSIVDLGVVVMGQEGQGPGRGIFGGGHPFPKAPAERKLVRNEEVARIFRDIHFAYDKHDLDKDAKVRLLDMANWLKRNASAMLTLEGHCDERGSATYNYLLGKRRALAASRQLSTLGIGASRLDTVSFGKMRPLNQETSEAAHRLNRRVHFLVFE